MLVIECYIFNKDYKCHETKFDRLTDRYMYELFHNFTLYAYNKTVKFDSKLTRASHTRTIDFSSFL